MNYKVKPRGKDKFLKAYFNYVGSVFFVLFAVMASTAFASDAPQSVSKVKIEEIVLDEVVVREYSGQYTIQVRLTSTINNDDFSRVDFSDFVSILPDVNHEIFPKRKGFVVKGNFRPGKSYTIKIARGVVSARGATLLRSIQRTVVIPKPSPHVHFPVKGRYVGKSGSMVIPVVVKNARETYISVFRIPERNITIWEEASSWSKRKWEETLVFEKKAHFEQIGKNLYGFDLKSWLPSDQKGLYHIVVKACGEQKKNCKSDNLYLVVTNIGLIVKAAPEKAYVWALALDTGAPLKDVDVKGFTIRNIEAGICKTDEQGYCDFTYNSHFKGKLSTIAARYGNDYTYLPLKATELDFSNFPVSGLDIEHVPCLSAFVMERDLLRPGETLNYSVVVRNPSDLTAMTLPITVKIRDPRDRILVKQQKVTDSFGVADFTYAISQDAVTGVYFLELYLGDRLLKTQKFYVETFVPQRIRAEIQASEKIFTKAEDISFLLKSEYLFGGPASGCQYNVYWALEPGDDKLFSEYHFGPVHVDGEDYESVYWDQSGEIGSKGFAQLKPVIDWSVTQNWPSTLRVSVDVYELGSGRTVFKSIEVPIRLSSRYPGLKVASVTPCQQAEIDGVVVDAFGNISRENVSLEYSVYEIEYTYALTYSPEGYRRWEKSALRVPVFDGGKVSASHGRFSIPVQLSQCWKDLIVKVKDPDAGTESEILISGWGDGEYPPSPESLKVVLSDKVITPGSTIKAMTKLPFKGRVLWVLETPDKVLDFEWKKDEENESSVEFIAPNNIATLYISAYLYKTSGADFLISRAFGLNRFQVIPGRIKAPISVKVPPMIRPDEKLKIELFGPPGGKILLAVVDEGILQITNFKSPDLYKLIMAPHELYTETSEGLGWVYPGKALMAGGGAEEDIHKSASFPRFFRTFSMWKVLRLSADGKATVTTELAHFQGDLRVMASVVTGSSFASAATHVKVTPEVAVLPTLPRVVRQGDLIRIPVQLTNTTSKTIDGTIRVVIAKNTLTRKISLSPHSSHIEEFPFEPPYPYGLVPVKIGLFYGKDKKWEDNYNISVMPQAVKQVDTLLVELKPQSNLGELNISNLLSEWKPYGMKVNVRVSSNPVLGIIGHVERLLKYPYGCVEQTSSKLLALVEALPILKFINPEFTEVEKIHTLVTKGIARLVKLQTYSGGFAFWPGDEREHWWGSIYATYALIKAKQAGFYVPESVISRALSNLKAMRSSPWRDFVLLESGQLRIRKPVWSSKAKDRESLLLLAWILHKEGFEKAAEDTLRMAHSCTKLTNSKDETFHSLARLLALDVIVSSKVASEPNEAGRIAGRFVKYFVGSAGPLTTQELAWAFSACKTLISRGSSQSTTLKAVLTLGGKKLKPLEIHDEKAAGRVLSWQVEEPLTKPCILKILSKSSAWITVSVDGFREPPNISSKNKILSIDVSVRGHKEDGSGVINLKKRERFLVKVTVTNKGKKVIRHVAARIFVPAGIEIVNPRLYNVKVKSPFEPSYIDVRDDEIRFFGNVSPGQHVLYFMAQAVFNSKSVMPPPIVEAMYDPYLFGCGNLKTFHVSER